MFQTKMLYGFKNTFNLNPTVKYDGFFESELLYDVLNLSPEECCLDFYGDKQNREGKRYWLSREIKNYKIIKSYALQLKPFELNIINGRDGDDLFLYDTSVVQTNKHKYSYNAFIEYLYSMNIKAQIKKYLKDFINKLV